MRAICDVNFIPSHQQALCSLLQNQQNRKSSFTDDISVIKHWTVSYNMSLYRPDVYLCYQLLAYNE